MNPRVEVLRPGVLAHQCPGCGERHVIDIHALSGNGKVIGWDGDVSRPNIGEPLRFETKDGRGHVVAVCEYVIRSGVAYYFENCTHALAGQSRHLQEIP